MVVVRDPVTGTERNVGRTSGGGRGGFFGRETRRPVVRDLSTGETWTAAPHRGGRQPVVRLIL